MKYKFLASLVLSGFIFQGSAFAATNNAMNPAQKKQVEGVVHDYLINNPDVVVQSLEIYQQKQMEQTKKTFTKIQNSLPKFADRLFHQASDPSTGNPNAKVTIVEFSDYQCPHCVEMTGILDEMVKKNDNLRIVFKEFPIRGPMSETAARAALAAQKQGKYFQLHNALMMSKTQPLTQEVIYNLAKTNGLNVDQLKKDMQDPSIDKQIKGNYQLAKEMELIWTPIFIIAKSNISNSAKPEEIIFIPGRVEQAQLDEVIKKLN